MNLQGTRRVISPSSLLPYIDKGDSEKVSFRGKEQTLHEVWDSGILETEEGSAKQIAKRLDEKVTDDDRKAWPSGTPKDWANESQLIRGTFIRCLNPMRSAKIMRNARFPFYTSA